MAFGRAQVIAQFDAIDFAGFGRSLEHQKGPLADRRQLADLQIVPARLVLFIVADEALRMVERIQILADDPPVAIQLP
jgi:hypothetical protein